MIKPCWIAWSLVLSAITGVTDASGAGAPQPARLLYARPFQVEEPYPYRWRGDHESVTTGSLIVVEADPALLQPGQDHRPLLFVGTWPAEPVNVGDGSGRVVALVPVPVSGLGREPIFYAQTGVLPESLSPQLARGILAAAVAEGLTPPAADALRLAREAGGFELEVAGHHELRRSAAGVVERYSPEERDVVRGLRAPRLPRRGAEGRRSLRPAEPKTHQVSTAARGAGIPGLIETELAGGGLASYPHFQYVRAFNAGAPIEIALDTSRFPGLAGATVDLYVVAAKTRAGWSSDPSLSDLTGLVETVVLGAGSISSNTFIVDSGTLSGDAGTRLGVGYDVVVDADRDGQLTSGDVIDGYGDEAGLYVVHDVTQPGPLTVAEALYSGGAFLDQITFYPEGVTELGQLPLVMISHGNGHSYLWYDHIGHHLASYGFVVVSHSTDAGAGVETAASDTLANTDYFLANLDLIAGGALDGHVDASRITWIGHSRGGEGVVRAYDRIFDGESTPAGYTLGQIVLVTSLAPTNFLGSEGANPHSATFSLWLAGADGDVTGCANNDVVQPLILLDRAADTRQSISLHGVGHGDFHNGSGSSIAVGPCQVGRTDTHAILRGYLLPLVLRYVAGNVPAEDFLWRQWESFRPIGAPTSPCVVVDLTYHPGDGASFVLDDFQREPSTAVASSGGAVTFDVTELTEDVLNDGDNSFSDVGPADVMNGMTVAGEGDESRGIVFTFDGSGPRFLDFAIPAGYRDLRHFEILSLRGAQQTRHPLTIAHLGDTTFTLTLRDAAGQTSSIDVAAYGGGLEEPYQREGCGSGAGWNNELETVRLRLSDFLHDGSGLDLADVRSLRFELGPGYGTAFGRLAFDDVEMTYRHPPLFMDGFESGDTGEWANTVQPSSAPEDQEPRFRPSDRSVSQSDL